MATGVRLYKIFYQLMGSGGSTPWVHFCYDNKSCEDGVELDKGNQGILEEKVGSKDRGSSKHRSKGFS